MNTLNKLASFLKKEKIDSSFKKGKIVIAEHVDKKDFFKAIEYAGAICGDAIEFDLGDLESTHSFVIFRDAYKLPYPVVYFDMHSFDKNGRMVRFGILAEDNIDRVGFSVFLIREDRFIFHDCGAFGLLDNSGEIKFYGLSKQSNINIVTELCISAVCKALSALSCANVKLKEQKPSRLASIKAKENKVPIFSTWTLTITDSKAQKTDKGGTHASPRVHLRRGHIRNCASGVRVWVQPCVVGSKHGIINKDYAFKKST